MSQPSRQPPSDKEVFVALKTAASSRNLTVSDRQSCQDDMCRLEYDLDSACELVAGCRLTQLRRSAPDDNPARDDQWIAILKAEPEEGEYLYVKVALRLPKLETGRFISFKKWANRHDQ